MEVKQSESGVWVGEKHPLLFHPNASLGCIILDSLNRNPDVVGLISHEAKKQKLNSEIRRDIIRVALNLQTDFGIGKSDVIGVVVANTLNVPVIVAAAFCLGAPISPLDPIASESEIAHIYAQTKPKLIICDSNCLVKVNSVVQSLGLNCDVLTITSSDTIPTQKTIDVILKPHPNEKLFRAPDLGETKDLIGVILGSSGSSGPPKPVALTQGVLIHYGRFMDFPLPNFKVRFNFSSLHWASGWFTTVSSLVAGSSRIVTSLPFTPQLALEIINSHKVEYFLCAPAHQILIANYLHENNLTFPSMKQFDMTGSLASEKHIQLMKHLVPQLEMGNLFGTSETYGILARSLDITQKYSAGRVFVGVEIKIVDDDENILKGNELGNIFVKNGFPLQYYNNPELSKLAFTEDGFFRTGDVGYFDSDGDLRMGGRKRENFKNNGFYVSPLEIENLIMTLDGILMVSVIGVPMADTNEHAAAFVVKTKASKVTKNDVAKLIENTLSHPKWLRGGIFFMEKLPTTISGKISKKLLSEMLKDGKIVEIE